MAGDLVKDYMAEVPVSVKDGALLVDVVETLLANNLTGVPVIDEHSGVVGFVSAQDCIHQMLMSSYHSEGVPVVNEIMRHDVLMVSPHDLIIDLAKQMDDRKPKIYPVVEHAKLVGLITRADVLRALKESMQTTQES